MSIANAPALRTTTIKVIENMWPGASYRMDNVSWQQYEQLLADLGDGYGVRVFYDQGRMEIMSPSYSHEKAAKIVHRLAVTLADELDLDLESAGSTTLKEEFRAKGAEPDESFYLQHAANIIGKSDDLDLTREPPPDVVIESDYTSFSLDKFPIYAGLGVPEIWRIHLNNVRIWLLTGNTYQEATHSQAFPFLPAAKLSELLIQGIAEGERKAVQALRKWLRETRKKRAGTKKRHTK